MARHPAPDRGPCPRCGIAGWRGCDHFAPFEPVEHSIPALGRHVPRHNIGGRTAHGAEPGAPRYLNGRSRRNG